MRSHRRFILSRYFTVALALAGCSQVTSHHPHMDEPGARAVCAQIVSEAPEAVRTKPGYQQLGIVVRDASGHERRDLAKDDFIVARAGTPLDVQFAKWAPQSPASVVILADTSGSTEPKLGQTREAVTRVADSLGPSDEVALFAFSGRPFKLQSFTTDHSAIVTQEQLFHSYGSTSLYDSAIAAGTLLGNQGCYAKRVLIVISDGIDNTSSHSLDDAVRDLTSDGVSAYAIAIGNPNAVESTARSLGPFVTVGGDADAVDEKTLGLLTDPGGGATFRVAAIADQDLLSAAAKTIMDRSRGQYVVGFIDPSKDDTSGVTIRIRNHDNYTVFRSRTGAPPASKAPPPAS